MLQILTREDNQENDTELQKNIRALAQEDIDTDDDKEFTVQEVKNVVLSVGKNKAPEEDCIRSEVFKSVVAMDVSVKEHSRRGRKKRWSYQ